MYGLIFLHPSAPPKPAEREPCNGCGVCCASEPCPIGILVSRRRTGACDALLWLEAEGRYRCGVVEEASAYLPVGLKGAAPILAKLVSRYISAGSGCDCSL